MMSLFRMIDPTLPPTWNPKAKNEVDDFSILYDPNAEDKIGRLES